MVYIFIVSNHDVVQLVVLLLMGSAYRHNVLDFLGGENKR